jgi:tRNA C32,U32 (ribose-2'-O)-methylase TrmJ
MQITQNFDSPITGVKKSNSTDNIQVNNNNKTTSLSTADEISISSQGMNNQKIDSLFDKADAIYQSHITPAQQKSLNESYAQLDELYSKSSPSDQEQKNADAIFDKIDKIFEQAEKKLTPLEKEQLETINTKLDELLGAEDIQLENGFSEEIEQLFQKSNDLLTSKISTQQKKSVDELNQQLNSLFEKNNINDDVNNLFDKINNILTQGYDKLSNDEKNKLEDYDVEIDELFDQIDEEYNEVSYP